MENKLITYGALGLVAVIAGGFLFATSVSADEGDTLSERVRGIFMSAEERDEHQAMVQEELKQAVADGDLTQEQLALHDAIMQERDEWREQRQESMKEEMLSRLAEAGYDVTENDLEELRDTMQELGFGPHGGMGKGGRMGGECMHDISE